MSIKLMSLVWQDHTGELTGIEKSVLLKMADHAADNGTQIYPSIKRISLDIGFSETAVKEAIKGLVAKKRITKTVRTSKLQHIPNLYRINIATLESAISPVDKYRKKTKTVDKPVKKSCIKEGGGSPDDPGVGRHTPGGGSPDDRNPPLIHHIKTSVAKDNNNCSKIEQEDELHTKPIGYYQVTNEEKAQIMRNMKKLINGMRNNR